MRLHLPYYIDDAQNCSHPDRASAELADNYPTRLISDSSSMHSFLIRSSFTNQNLTTNLGMLLGDHPEESTMLTKSHHKLGASCRTCVTTRSKTSGTA